MDPAAEHYRWFKERTGSDPDSFGKYLLAGGDLVKLFIERYRKCGQTPFISLRMNDAHHLEYVSETTDSRAEELLFEPPADPSEKSDLLPSRPADAERHKTKLAAWEKEVKPVR